MNNNKIIESNLQALSQYNPFVAAEIAMDSKAEVVGIVEERKDGIIKFWKGSDQYLLQSKYDPKLEAEMLINKINFKKDNLIIVFGIGLGHHLFALKKYISKDSRVIIVEHNQGVLNYAMNNVDLSALFNSPQFYLIYGNDELKDMLIINCFNNNFHNLVLNIEIITLLNYHVYEQENVEVLRKISKRITSTLYSFGNALDDMLTGFQNNYLNIDALIQTNSINEVRGMYKGMPAVIVASGPSLDKNIHLLKQAQGKALIVACDASLEACLSQGVTPDVIASIERDEPTYSYYYENKVIDEDIVLAGPGLLWPKIFEEYAGKKIIMSKMDSGVEGWWHDHFENTEHVNIGQSSATVAFAVAREAGCNPIILIGQDLAFSEGRKHSDATHTEHEGENDDSEFDGTYVEDYEGNVLRSDKIYLLFKTWYEYQIIANPELQVIDATQGGAYIKGSKVIDFKDAIQLYCRGNLEQSFNQLLQDVKVTDEYVLNKYDEVMKSIERELGLLEHIAKLSNKHMGALRKIEQKYDFNSCSKNVLFTIIEEMQAGDEIVNELLHKQDVLQTFYKQIVTQTIIFVKQIGNEVNNESVKRNFDLQLSLMYMVANSTGLIIDEFKAARDFILKTKEKFISETPGDQFEK